MIVGAAQADITPDFAVDLSGFAARTQPATGVLDPLLVKCLYLQDGQERLLWTHADVIALDAPFVANFREWARSSLGLRPDQVIVSATHTHSAPATISLTGCGTSSERFIELLQSQARLAARRAADIAQPAVLHFATANCNLAIDRRNKPSAHTDHTVTALAFRSSDDTIIAAVVNYGMHPVALGATNRKISADWCGSAADSLRAQLPGRPIVLATNGACGNINPPFQDVTPQQVQELGCAVTRSLAERLLHSPSIRAALDVRRQLVSMPLETLLPDEKNRYADKWLDAIKSNTRWESALRKAIERWRITHHPDHFDIELFVLGIGPIAMITCNGELFSRFTADLRSMSNRDLFTVTYANAAFGYIPTRAAYAEGGYETDTAHLFYNSLRPQIGSLEVLTERAADMLRTL